ncbi:thioredoxin family protein [Pseudomonadota bacterium]
MSAPPASASEMREDGIHTESWFKNMSFLDLREDLAEAKEAGKGLVLLFEQPGCGSCKRLHEETLQDKGVIDYLSTNYDIIVLNMFGSKEVTDFDGEMLTEADFAEKHMTHFSPTTLFIGDDGKVVFTVPGFKNAYFYQSAFEFVADRGPQQDIMFPRWLRAKRDRLAAEQQASTAK